MRSTTSPSVSPKKKKGRVESQSAIRTAISQANADPRGLMKFFKQNSRQEYNEQVRRHTAEEDEFARNRQEIDEAIDRHRTEKVKEGARERQQKHRQKIYDAEITKGERSPSGTKHKRKVSDIIYSIELGTKLVISARTCRT
jgi:hypothetical protein